MDAFALTGDLSRLEMGLDAVTSRARAYAEATSAAARASERHRTALQNQTRAADLASGAFARHAAAMAKLNAETRKLDNRERLNALVAVHGKLGGIIRHNSAQLAILGRTALAVTGMGLAMGMGLVRSGLAGTQEGVRLEMSWMRLSRQLAAVAVPAIEMLSSVLQRVAGWFERLSGAQQNNIMRVGLFAAGVLTLAGAFRLLLPLAGAVRGILASIGLVGAAGAVSGAVAASAAGASVAARGLTGAAAMNAAGGLGGTAAAAAGGGMLARAGSLALKAAIPAAVAVAAVEMSDDRKHKGETPGDYYRRLKTEGRSSAGAAFSVFGKSLETSWRSIFGGKEAFKDDEKEKRRDITPFGNSSEEAGGAHFRIQEELLKVEAAKSEEAKEMVEALKALTEVMKGMPSRTDPGDASTSPTGEGTMGWYGDTIRKAMRDSRAGK